MNYLRYCNVTAANGISFSYGGSAEESGLRIRFEINAAPFLSPTIAKIMVTNPLASNARNTIVTKSVPIVIDAGYNDNHGVIFKGELKQSIYGRESPTDTLLTLYAATMDANHNYSTVSTTLPPGSTPQQHMNVALQAMPKLSPGYVDPMIDLSKPVYPRAVTLLGMARDVLLNIGKSKDAMVRYDHQDNTLIMMKQGNSLPGGPIVLNSSSGLIGMPTQSLEGIFARCLINPRIHVHSQVQIDEKDIQGGAAPIIAGGTGGTTAGPQSILAPVATDGLYTVYKVDVFGDTRSNDWYMDLAMFASNSAKSPAEAAAIAAQGLPQLGPD